MNPFGLMSILIAVRRMSLNPKRLRSRRDGGSFLGDPGVRSGPFPNTRRRSLWTRERHSLRADGIDLPPSSIGHECIERGRRSVSARMIVHGPGQAGDATSPIF